MKKIIFTYILLSFSVLIAYSQTYSTQNKKAIASYNEALKNFQLQYFDIAETQLKEALKQDNTFSEAYFLLAGIYAQKNNTTELIRVLQQSVDLCGNKTPIAYYKLAYEQYDNGFYTEALRNTQLLEQKQSALSEKEKKENQELMQKCSIAIDIQKQSVQFKPKNLGPNINTIYDDYHPAITLDDELLIITSNLPTANPRMFQEDMFYAHKKNDIWLARQVFPSPITTNQNEGAQSISADGNTMIYTMCHAPGGFGSCDIYITYRAGNQWTKPQNIGPPINTKYWESQPSLSADGRTLYFVSNRPGGMGKKDIWKSSITEKNTWSEPENLGSTINTIHDEESPFIHADGISLYFSSDGHPGMGKKDIFFSQIRPNNTWMKPINIGFPINTHDKESHIVINAQGTKGYFASNRYGSIGGYDIYDFSIDNSFLAKPNPVTFVEGIVFNAKNKQEKIPAFIELTEIVTNEIYYQNSANSFSGAFIAPFVEQKTYALSVSHPGYLFFSENIQLSKTSTPLQIALQPIAIGSTVILNNVFFDTDSYELKPESITELHNIVLFMKQNPSVSFEIGGHTDNTGNKQHNITLSTNRAKSVNNFLVSQGIQQSRLTYKGFAETKPIADNNTAENRAKNRRTELIITKI